MNALSVVFAECGLDLVNRDNHPRNPMLSQESPDCAEAGLTQIAERPQLNSKIDLPDIADLDSRVDWGCDSDSVVKPNENRHAPKVGIALLLVAALIAGFAMHREGATEHGHENWAHVSAAEVASDSAVNRLVHVSTAGAEQIVSGIEVSYQDANRSLMRQIRTALLRQNVTSANQLLGASHKGMELLNSFQPPDLAANTALVAAFQDRGNELFEIFLFDCCAEDGDVVEILVNDIPFSIIPITHQGSTVAIPLHRGVNSLTIRGVSDGGGGITVGFRTSRGDFYSGSMSEGQDHRLGVIVK